MTVITVSGLADGSMWLRGRAGRCRVLVDRVELAGKNLYCSFCFQHAISESPADEEEQWSDDFVSICSWDEKGTISPWPLGGLYKDLFLNEMLVFSCPSQRGDSWVGRATNRRDSTRLTWANTTLCRARSFTPTTSCNPHHSPMSRHSYPHFLLVCRTKKRCLSV